ncbi:MAG TPA: hypothetical protein VFS43_17195 [Polyangiaceae bacterium]|nr:hypothetical protein [Polyangiaceae bacterium]
MLDERGGGALVADLAERADDVRVVARRLLQELDERVDGLGGLELAERRGGRVARALVGEALQKEGHHRPAAGGDEGVGDRVLVALVRLEELAERLDDARVAGTPQRLVQLVELRRLRVLERRQEHVDPGGVERGLFFLLRIVVAVAVAVVIVVVVVALLLVVEEVLVVVEVVAGRGKLFENQLGPVGALLVFEGGLAEVGLGPGGHVGRVEPEEGVDGDHLELVDVARQLFGEHRERGRVARAQERLARRDAQLLDGVLPEDRHEPLERRGRQRPGAEGLHHGDGEVGLLLDEAHRVALFFRGRGGHALAGDDLLGDLLDGLGGALGRARRLVGLDVEGLGREQAEQPLGRLGVLERAEHLDGRLAHLVGVVERLQERLERRVARRLGEAPDARLANDLVLVFDERERLRLGRRRVEAAEQLERRGLDRERALVEGPVDERARARAPHRHHRPQPARVGRVALRVVGGEHVGHRRLAQLRNDLVDDGVADAVVAQGGDPELHQAEVVHGAPLDRRGDDLVALDAAAVAAGRLAVGQGVEERLELEGRQGRLELRGLGEGLRLALGRAGGGLRAPQLHAHGRQVQELGRGRPRLRPRHLAGLLGHLGQKGHLLAELGERLSAGHEPVVGARGAAARDQEALDVAVEGTK